VPRRNRVDPYGEIVETPLRGSWMGNRGCIHRGYRIVRPWNGKRWIVCALAFRGWVAPKWAPGRWTALFFYDEAVALAAGHRPCALCRRADYERFSAAAELRGAEAIDGRLHGERVDGRQKRRHVVPWRALPVGAFADLEGVPHVVLRDRLRPWSPSDGYGSPVQRPSVGVASVLTPPLSLRALDNGYPVQINP